VLAVGASAFFGLIGSSVLPSCSWRASSGHRLPPEDRDAALALLDETLPLGALEVVGN
jgi:hypothetical protein